MIDEILKIAKNLVYFKFETLSEKEINYFGEKLIGTEFDDFENKVDELFDDDKFIEIIENIDKYIYDSCITTNISRFCKACVRKLARNIVLKYLQLNNLKTNDQYNKGFYEFIERDIRYLEEFLNKKDFYEEEIEISKRRINLIKYENLFLK